jgi:biopolymer transport protein ExbD
MSSMTDLVFLLLIFFVIVSTLVSPYALPVDLPKGTAAKPRKGGVTLRIDANEQILLNGRTVLEAALEDQLKQEMAGQAEEPIALHVDQMVPTGLTVTVLDIAKRNRWKIALATKPG